MFLSRLDTWLKYSVAVGLLALSSDMLRAEETALIPDNVLIADVKVNSGLTKTKTSSTDPNSNIKPHDESAESNYGAADGTPPEVHKAKKDAPNAIKETPLALEGKPGDVRLVVATTTIAARQRWVVPKIPLPPFYQWNQWLDKHEISAHSSLDWMDQHGKWWHTEIRGFDQYDAQYRVGQGEFQGTGITIYGVFIMPGRTNPEDQKVLVDEKVKADYRVIESEARKYGLKTKTSGEAGTNGNGKSNVGLGGPAFKPSQNCNTFIHFLLKKADADRPSPPGAVGWDTVPHFPFSADADE